MSDRKLKDHGHRQKSGLGIGAGTATNTSPGTYQLAEGSHLKHDQLKTSFSDRTVHTNKIVPIQK